MFKQSFRCLKYRRLGLNMYQDDNIVQNLLFKTNPVLICLFKGKHFLDFPFQLDSVGMVVDCHLAAEEKKKKLPLCFFSISY